MTWTETYALRSAGLFEFTVVPLRLTATSPSTLAALLEMTILEITPSPSSVKIAVQAFEPRSG